MISQITEWKNLHAAFEKVRESRGMAGIDGVNLSQFSRNLDACLGALQAGLASGEYSPWPLLRFLAAKPDGSPRMLSVPAVIDRVAQAAVGNIISPLLEAEFEDASFAYRKGRSVRMAAQRIRELHGQGWRHVVEVDIVGYFDNIDHGLLFKRLSQTMIDARVLSLVEKWVKTQVYDGQSIFPLEKGLPQGAVIAPMLANLFLDDLDESLLGQGFQLVRYSDDFVVLAKKPEQAKAALELTEDILRDLGLEVDWKDTRLTDFEKGFKFLGLIFLGDGIFAPFETKKRRRKVLYMPPPLDKERYLAAHRKKSPGEIQWPFYMSPNKAP